MFTYSTKFNVDGDNLEITISDYNSQYNLQKIINSYSEDNGCIALGYRNTKENLIWFETTRFTSLFKAPLGKSYSSLYQSEYSINASLDHSGQHNIASPAWVLTEVHNILPIMYILTPYKNCPVSESILLYHDVRYPEAPLNHKVSTHNFFVSNILQKNVEEIRSIKEFLHNWQQIEFIQIESNKYKIEANTKADIYLKTSSGVLNRNKCKSGDIVTINMDGLNPEEQITIKAGYKFYPSISSKVLIV
jgi:hypothetical protein